MGPVANFTGFLHAIAKHWVALMSGGAAVVILGLFERFSGKDVPLWAYAFVTIGFVIIAAYLTWRDAVQKNVELLQRLADDEPKPELHGYINQVHIEESRDLVFVEISLWNVKKTATSIREFRIKILTLENEYDGVQIDGAWYTFIPPGFQDDCENRKALKVWELSPRPLPDGYKRGIIEKDRWLCFSIITRLPEDIRASVTAVTVTAVDVFDIPHRVKCQAPLVRVGHIIY